MPETSVSAHGPYEDFGIALLRVVEKLIDGQTVEQRAKLWQDWIDFWSPFVTLMKGGAR